MSRVAKTDLADLRLCGPPLPRDRVDMPDPLMVRKSLSPGTPTYEITKQAQDYFRLPSNRQYLIFAVERPRLVHHRRDPRDRRDRRACGDGRPVRLDPPGLTFTLQDI